MTIDAGGALGGVHVAQRRARAEVDALDVDREATVPVASSCASTTLPLLAMPALLNRTSIRPNAATVASTAASTDAASATSATTARALPPPFSTRATVSSAASFDRSSTATAAPSRHEPQRRLAADARSAAGDHRYASGQSIAHVHTSFQSPALSGGHRPRGQSADSTRRAREAICLVSSARTMAAPSASARSLLAAIMRGRLIRPQSVAGRGGRPGRTRGTCADPVGDLVGGLGDRGLDVDDAGDERSCPVVVGQRLEVVGPGPADLVVQRGDVGVVRRAGRSRARARCGAGVAGRGCPARRPSRRPSPCRRGAVARACRSSCPSRCAPRTGSRRPRWRC